jgi:hypothetical protein
MEETTMRATYIAAILGLVACDRAETAAAATGTTGNVPPPTISDIEGAQPTPANNNISEIDGAKGNQPSEINTPQGNQPAEIDGPAGNNISEIEDTPEPPNDPVSEVR